MVDAPYGRGGIAVESRTKAKTLSYWLWLAVTLGVMAAVAVFIFLR